MSDELLQRGDMVFFWNEHHKVRYFGIIIKEVSPSTNTRRYSCRFWNHKNKYFGRRLFIDGNKLEFIAHMPDGVEWDLDETNTF